MNIAKSFVGYLEDKLSLTFGTDLFIGGVPQNAPDSAWWVISAGGSPIIKNKTNEKLKNYLIQVFYRNTDAEDVYDKLQQLENDINSELCPELEDFDTVEIEATAFPADQDLDVEDRTIGLLQVTLTVYSGVS